MDLVGIGRPVLTSQEHVIALERLRNGLMDTLLRYPYEVNLGAVSIQPFFSYLHSGHA